MIKKIGLVPLGTDVLIFLKNVLKSCKVRFEDEKAFQLRFKIS